MFTTPSATPVGGFVDGTSGNRGSRLRAAWLNDVSGQFPNALDAVGGGYYQFAGNDIRLSSDVAKVKINAPAVGQPTKLLGYLTIGPSDDPNYTTGTGTLTVSIPSSFSAGVTMGGALSFLSTVQFNGAVTFASGGDITLQSGCVLTGSSGSTVSIDVLNVGNTLTMGTDKDIVLTGAGTIKFATSRSYRQPCRLVWVDPAYWGPDSTLPLAWPHRVQQTNATSPSSPTTNLRYECNVPSGASVVNVSVYIHPASGHVGIPNNRPQLIVWIYDSDGETCDQTGSAAIATNASIPAYENRQLLVVTAAVNTITSPQKVVCQVFGEGGANFVAGLVVDEPTFGFSTEKMAEP